MSSVSLKCQEKAFYFVNFKLTFERFGWKSYLELKLYLFHKSTFFFHWVWREDRCFRLREKQLILVKNWILTKSILYDNRQIIRLGLAGSTGFRRTGRMRRLLAGTTRSNSASTRARKVGEVTLAESLVARYSLC